MASKRKQRKQEYESKKISFKDQAFFIRKLRFETGLSLPICRKAAELVNFKSIEEAKRHLFMDEGYRVCKKSKINKTEDKIVPDQVKHYDW